MKIELKAIQYSEFASEETSCYQANLYVNGKKIGTVSNAGKGGCDSFYGDQTAYKEADEWCKANLPKWTLDGVSDEPHDTDLEHHCSDLLTTWLYTRDLKRAMRGKILFKLDDGALYQVKHRTDTATAAAQVQERHPKATILNTLPIDQALKIYRATAQ